MHYRLELIYAAWRWMRDAVRALLPRPERVPMPEPLDRAGLFHQLTELRACRAEAVRRYQQAIEALTRELLPAQATVDTLRRALAELHADQFYKSLQASAEEDRLLAQITEKSSMSVQLFIEEMDHELDVLHRTEETIVPTADRNYSTGKKSMGVTTDGPSRQRRARAIHRARARAIAMQNELMTVEAMNTELIHLRKSIPDVTSEVLHGERASIVAYN